MSRHFVARDFASFAPRLAFWATVAFQIALGIGFLWLILSALI